MAEEKTYVFGDGNNNIPLAYALNNGYGYGNGLFGGNGSGFGAGILGGLLGGLIWNGIGLGNWGMNNWNNGGGAAAASLGAQATAIGNTETILRAIDGTDSDVRLLATTLNSDVNTVKTNLATLQNGLTALTGQTGLSAQQIINSIQAGNASMAENLCRCCCEQRQLTVEQGYQNQIRTLEQTSALAGQADRNTAQVRADIAAQTTMINDQFCQLKEREMQAKIDNQADIITQLRGQIDNSNQTNQIIGYVNSVVTPLQRTIDKISANQPNTVPVQYPNLSVVNNTPYAGGFYGNGWNGFGFGNGYGFGF